MAPYNDDWLHIRAASVAYQLYMTKNTGVKTLRKHYGSNQRNGTNTEHGRIAAGKNIRYCLLQLEAAGIVGKANYLTEDGADHIVGKSLTKKGRMDMDRIAANLVKASKK